MKILIYLFRTTDIKLNIASQDLLVFPDENVNEVISIPEVEQRIKDNLLVLSNFKKFREQNRYVNVFTISDFDILNFNSFFLQ